MTLSGATTAGQSGYESNGNERVLHIPQISKAGASPSDCLVSYQDTRWEILTSLQRYSWYILQSQPTGLEGKIRQAHICIQNILYIYGKHMRNIMTIHKRVSNR